MKHLSHASLVLLLIAAAIEWTHHPNASAQGTQAAAANAGYESKWKGSRRWIGPDWWANPLTDWSLRNDAVVSAAAANRTLCLLPADLESVGNDFSMRVEIESIGTSRTNSPAAGFRIGRRGGIDDYRHALVHATNWIDAKISVDGRLSLGTSRSDETLTWDEGKVVLQLVGEREGDSVRLRLSATQGSEQIDVAASFAIDDVVGGVSLLADGPNRPGGVHSELRFAFRDFRIHGDLLRHHPQRTFGPILWTQYSLSRNRLRLQTQLAPLGRAPGHQVELWIAEAEGDPQWTKVAVEPMENLSRTATFTIDSWDSSVEKRYQVRFSWRNQQHAFAGRIRREPEAGSPVKLGCFSCDNGYLFPIPVMVSQVLRQNPDIVFFAGDQIYESYGGFGVARNADTETAMLDYLRKYYQFGWTWRDVLRDRPSVILPDDHDVFQGNIWGHGGRKLPPSDKKNDWALGGYLMPGEWVAAVEKTQVGHLPDPAIDMTLPIGIKPYFTGMTYAGIGFAILEDRKFKTGVRSLPVAKQPQGEGADLLGAEQEAFLMRWSNDWNGQQMKCALSQTIFCNASTHTGQTLRRGRYYYDSGAWPIAARNRVVRVLGDCNALAIHGDQHLGVLLRHGVEEFDDAGYAFMVPGTANGFPRAWWPGVNDGVPDPDADYTGRYRDDAGHPIHVLAVGNPEPGSNLLPKTVDPMEIGYRKGSGYGLVEFHPENGSATISLFRLGDQEVMFPGFPQTIQIGRKP